MMSVLLNVLIKHALYWSVNQKIPILNLIYLKCNDIQLCLTTVKKRTHTAEVTRQ